MAFSDRPGNPIAAAFQIHPGDNVATLLQSADVGPVAIRTTGEEKIISLQEPVPLGHKVAIVKIDTGEEIVKYGVVIGVASKSIDAGQWVHLHNCRSRLDERSGTLGLHTGLPEDTKYE